MSTVSAVAAERKDRTRILTMYASSTYGPATAATIHKLAIVPTDASLPDNACRSRGPFATGRSAMAETCGADAQEKGCQNHDRQSTDDGADEGGDQHLGAAKRDRRGRKA